MNTLTIFVIGVFLVFILIGYRRGLVKSVVKIVIAGLSLVLAYILTPFVGNLLIEYTNFDDYFREKINSGIKSYIEDTVENEVSSTIIGDNAAAVDELVTSAMNIELTKNQQIDMIDKIPAPDFVKNALIENNYDEMYKSMGVNGFYDYVATYISHMITNAIAFAITFIVIGLVFAVVYVIMCVAVELPIISSINRFGGLAFGAVEAFIIVWLIFTLAVVFSNTKIGAGINSQIDESAILTSINRNNLFVSIITNLVKIK